jgi:hypothetical protein
MKSNTTAKMALLSTTQMRLHEVTIWPFCLGVVILNVVALSKWSKKLIKSFLPFSRD